MLLILSGICPQAVSNDMIRKIKGNATIVKAKRDETYQGICYVPNIS